MTLFQTIQNYLQYLVPDSLKGKTEQQTYNVFGTNPALPSQMINVYYNIKKNVEYMSVGKTGLYCIHPHYTPSTISGITGINCNLSRQIFAGIARDNHHFGRYLNYAIRYNNSLKYYRSIRAKGLCPAKCALPGVK